MCDARRPTEGADSAPVNLWKEFEADERKWANAGSGMTLDQITGAAMMLSWMEQRTRNGLNSPEQQRLRAEEEERL